MSGSPDGGYALYVDITYKDGSNTWGYTVPFDTGTHGWQYKAGVIDEGKPIKSLTVHAMFRWHTGTVRLRPAPGPCLPACLGCRRAHPAPYFHRRVLG